MNASYAEHVTGAENGAERAENRLVLSHFLFLL